DILHRVRDFGILRLFQSPVPVRRMYGGPCSFFVGTETSAAVSCGAKYGARTSCRDGSPHGRGGTTGKGLCPEGHPAPGSGLRNPPVVPVARSGAPDVLRLVFVFRGGRNAGCRLLWREARRPHIVP